ncbi:MAG: phycobilisome rod-core linker polypeptide [Cyanobacteria bacterium]|nr:phycobilisome rod-core linker polypeptide [Cyanobacteriota bacterium]
MTSPISASLKFGAETKNASPVSFSRGAKTGTKPALTNEEFKIQSCESSKIAIGPRNHEDCPHGVVARKYAQSDNEGLEAAIAASYRQVYGNAHVMENERDRELEAGLSNGTLCVREFVKGLAKTSFYKSRFFDEVSPQRGIELNIQHLLGRAPINHAEISKHIALLAESGHNSVIDFIVGSAEYAEVFGRDTVPYKRTWRSAAGIPTNNFVNLASLERGFAISDNVLGNKSITANSLARGTIQQIKLPKQVYASVTTSQSGSSVRYDYSKPNNSQVISGTVTPMRNDSYVSFGLGQREQEIIQSNQGDGIDQKYAVIRASYKQVMGNPHLMESERSISAESKFVEGYSSTRELVRSIAQSPEYSKRFFENSAPYRFVELNFKHLLGRAPASQSELAEHIKILAEGGYEAEINSYMDSSEYQSMFGEDTVPYMRILSEKGRSQIAFNRHLALSEGYAASDSVASSSSLVTSVATGLVPQGWGDTKVRINRGVAISNIADPTKKKFRIMVQAQPAGGRQRTPNASYIVSGKDMSTQLKYIHARGGKISSIAEIL